MPGLQQSCGSLVIEDDRLYVWIDGLIAVDRDTVQLVDGLIAVGRDTVQLEMLIRFFANTYRIRILQHCVEMIPGVGFIENGT